MSNAWYDLGLEGIGDQSIAMLTDDIRVAFINATYVPNTVTDKFLSDVGSGNILARTAALTGKSFTAGVFRAANTTVTVTGAATQACIFKHTGSDATARVVMYLDVAVGLPFTGAGESRPVIWNTGALGIGKL